MPTIPETRPVYTTVKIPKVLHKQLRVFTIDSEMAVQHVVEDAIKEYLAARRKLAA